MKSKDVHLLVEVVHEFPLFKIWFKERDQWKKTCSSSPLQVPYTKNLPWCIEEVVSKAEDPNQAS